MFKNNLKIALRNLLKYKAFSLINIAGLAVGIACFIMLAVWVQDELSYDRFHDNINELYRIIRIDGEESDRNEGPGTSFVLPTTLKERFPEIKDFSRYVQLSSFQPSIVKYQPSQESDEVIVYNEPDIVLVDSSFFNMFSFEFSLGDPNTAISDLTSCVITEETAGRYFGDKNPIGKTLVVNDQQNLVVSGVIKNVPENSTIQFDFAISIQVLGDQLETWAIFGGAYLLLEKNVNVKDFDDKLYDAVDDVSPDFSLYMNHRLQPVPEMHLDADLGGDGNKTYVYIFSIVAVFIILIACINFMNLSTARSSLRIREIGVKKVVGAYRRQLIRQFYTESLLYSLIALLIGMAIFESLLPAFRNFTGKDVGLQYFDNFYVIPGLLGIAMIIGLIAGTYPSMILSAFRPIKMLQGNILPGTKKSTFRTILVIFQFAISISLIIGTTFVYKQLKFVKNKSLGFDRENVVAIPIKSNMRFSYDPVKLEFEKCQGVINVTTSNRLPNSIGNINPVYWEGHTFEDNVTVNFVSVDFNYIETMKMEMVLGRSFSRDFPSDSGNYIINEALLKLTELEDPIGKMFSLWEYEGKIIGIVKDFHHQSLHNDINPLVLNFAPGWYFSPYFLIRIEPDNITATLERLENVLLSFDSEYPFEYQFIDESFEAQYRSEEQLSKVFNYFAYIAIFISCLGLFGLASFMAERRTKEIGIRKVFGSSVPRILLLLSKDFTKWVLIANIIAWPVLYYFMKSWLQNFVYHTKLSIWVFVFAGILSFVIALLTISYRAYKSAKQNPAKALRYE